MTTIIDKDALKRAATMTVDEHGQLVAQIPLKVWQELVGKEPEEALPQHERIKAVLQEIKDNPDKRSDAWWDEFNQFLRENRVNLRNAIWFEVTKETSTIHRSM